MLLRNDVYLKKHSFFNQNQRTNAKKKKKKEFHHLFDITELL